MTDIFISGMGRSGTTLLDRLLTNHVSVDVLSQPLPLFFVEAKKQFLKGQGIEKYFVLNDDLVNRCFTQEEFDKYLSEFTLDLIEVENIFAKMSTYSGQYTKRELSQVEHIYPSIGFAELLETCRSFYKTNKMAIHHGFKETMCEEFFPYLCSSGFKCILIVRDVRDVLASANYPQGAKYFGEKKPTLFVLRSWRKSVEYASLLKNNSNFHLLRYEDLVETPYKELDRIANFLGIPDFKTNQFDEGILDRNGELWQSNSSFDIQGSFISKESKEMYKQILSDKEIKYTEAICRYELAWLGYRTGEQSNIEGTIRNFSDYGLESTRNLCADFSSSAENVDIEIKRRPQHNHHF